ncbi:2-oxoadipate dioxygenase/decarboxylase HglS [Acuticoccus mangrovi]|uniref:2-oxoadipate dioxygenase/decarboxylase n=1 Tax=Acuticoccus mangrovi TaxID=2796142 RepID=A0A934IPU4_9HYPH|nr:VOC family protein [Acuticoccus mangrovi]MBJ3776107.1 VOC family protein [Acuticoccus mangrovi]
MTLVPTSELRARFAAAMSEMYRAEVPLYGELLDLVDETNRAVLASDPGLYAHLVRADDLSRISQERHGAIRLGTPEELYTMRRLFALFGMSPVGYYDLSVAGIPVHATAFRPVEAAALRRNPFRVFTSLLRLELIEDAQLRAEAEAILKGRDIFGRRLWAMMEAAEAAGGIAEPAAEEFIEQAVAVFAWRSDARVSASTYLRLHDAHRLVADVVSFEGPHINHLTPRTLDIDMVQAGMPARGISPKAVIEGPPRRSCPILLRQTSFKALEERITFLSEGGEGVPGSHTARFGEIEQRGVALTPKGRALYDRCLAAARAEVRPAADGSNAAAYMSALEAAFRPFPDDHHTLWREGLAYYHHLPANGRVVGDLEVEVEAGNVAIEPIVYEDFLPVSAAGIFQSNLGDKAGVERLASANRERFVAALGVEPLDPFSLYRATEDLSRAACRGDRPAMAGRRSRGAA